VLCSMLASLKIRIHPFSLYGNMESKLSSSFVPPQAVW
jgi:hypothetical protein